MTPDSPSALEVTDVALAKIAAQAAIRIPGVARLSPSLPYLVKGVVTDIARRLTTQDAEPAEAADPDAVEIEVDDGTVEVRIRLVASGNPPVVQAVAAVQRAVRRDIARIDSRPSVVTVLVVDTDEA